MIEIDLKINPYGLGEHEIKVGNIYIAKTRNYTGLSNYVYLIYEPKSKFSEEIIIHGIIRNHDRNNPLSVLLRKVMIDYGKSKCNTSTDYASHWLSRTIE